MKYISLLLFLLAGSAWAETTDVLIQQLTETVRTELNDPKSPIAGNRDAQFKILTDMGQIKVNYADGKPRRGGGDYLLSSVEEMRTVSQSHAIQELCQTISQQLRRELAERQAAALEKIKTETSAAIRQALAAKSPRDFDDPLAVMTRIFSDGEIINSKDPAHEKVVGQVGHVRQFLVDLQDYLVNLGLETSVISENRWRNLTTLRDDFSLFVPRSEVLAGLQEFHQRNGVPEGRKPMTQEDFEKIVGQIVAEAKSLEDLEKANAELTKWMHADQAVGLRMDSLSRSMTILREYARIYAEVKSGTVSEAEVASLITRQPDLHNDVFRNLSQQLILAALPPLLQTPMAAKAGESPAIYVQRVAENAVAAADWATLARAIDIMPTVTPNSRSLLAGRLTAQFFLAGLNQERARQYALAVSSYQKALRAGSLVLPAEMIGEHLEAIRQAHPEEFEQGTKDALSGTSLFPHFTQGTAPAMHTVPVPPKDK